MNKFTAVAAVVFLLATPTMAEAAKFEAEPGSAQLVVKKDGSAYIYSRYVGESARIEKVPVLTKGDAEVILSIMKRVVWDLTGEEKPHEKVFADAVFKNGLNLAAAYKVHVATVEFDSGQTIEVDPWRAVLLAYAKVYKQYHVMFAVAPSPLAAELDRQIRDMANQ
ncbi:hypothetical protein ACFL2D_03060 [Patescibacteria group bacterium]